MKNESIITKITKGFSWREFIRVKNAMAAVTGSNEDIPEETKEAVNMIIARYTGEEYRPGLIDEYHTYLLKEFTADVVLRPRSPHDDKPTIFIVRKNAEGLISSQPGVVVIK